MPLACSPGEGRGKACQPQPLCSRGPENGPGLTLAHQSRLPGGVVSSPSLDACNRRAGSTASPPWTSLLSLHLTQQTLGALCFVSCPGALKSHSRAHRASLDLNVSPELQSDRSLATLQGLSPLTAEVCRLGKTTLPGLSRGVSSCLGSRGALGIRIRPMF